ncbi:MAG TPA: rhomboid family intramembrane serine protease [Planctomycetaceae bacterium]|nr:rhomboid family intramembrane serine protease [Planctomycetaceae bacterium]
MRHIGNLPTEEQASAFEDFMLASEMRVRVDPEDSEWAVWVIEEDQFDAAREQLARFREDPSNSRYNSHSAKARQIRREEKKAAEQFKKNQINVRTRWGRSRSGLKAGPATKALIGISILVGLMAGLNPRDQSVYPWLTFTDFTQLRMSSTLGLEGILSGEIWRIITPIFIHYDPLHILFNMMWMYQLGPQIESRIGSARFLLLVLAVAAISNAGQFAWDRVSAEGGLSRFGGMSGVVCGLFGYIWMKVRFEPQERYVMPLQTIRFMLIFLALCTFGIFGDIANGAHLVGLLVGVIFGYWNTFVRENLR